MSSPVIRMMAAMIVATAVATQPAVGVCRRAAQMSPPVVDEAGAESWGTLASDVSFSRLGSSGRGSSGAPSSGVVSAGDEAGAGAFSEAAAGRTLPWGSGASTSCGLSWVVFVVSIDAESSGLCGAVSNCLNVCYRLVGGCASARC